MKHLQVISLLSALSSARKIMSDLQEYDDSDIIELLEMKYEKLFPEFVKES